MTPYEREEAWKRLEHAFAHAHGFYRTQVWWIDTYRIDRTSFYRFVLNGRNGHAGDTPYLWRVPSLRPGGARYAFTLTPVN